MEHTNNPHFNEKKENSLGEVSDSQNFFVPLHQDLNSHDTYGTDNHRRAEKDVPEHDTGQRHERLGIHAYEVQGRPTLDNRWDTIVYEEGLRDDLAGDKLGSSRLAICAESDRLISVAKQVGDYIPSSIWDTFGRRVQKPSGESIVFTDVANERVIKFKDPFAYVAIKDDNPYTALYEHHIHNHFFGDVGYRFLGVSQDPVNGGVRFAFEQPFIDSINKPTKEEISKWFKERGFELTDDGFFYTDGYVSFTDVWGDNCIKDNEGKLHFIDPIIKFNREPKEVLSHYIEQSNALKEGLDKAGITVGSRFRVDRLNSFNDMEVRRIDFGSGKVTFGPTTTHPDYQGEFEWSIHRVLDNIKMYQGSRWIQVDENRNDIVIPSAKQAILTRANDPSPRASFTDSQMKALERFCTLYSDKIPKEEILLGLVDSMGRDFKEARIPDGWVKDVREEIVELAHGERREAVQGMRR